MRAISIRWRKMMIRRYEMLKSSRLEQDEIFLKSDMNRFGQILKNGEERKLFNTPRRLTFQHPQPQIKLSIQFEIP